MIRLFLSGGLGNQLFQYATARAVSIRTGASLEVDLRFYDKSVEGTPKGAWLANFPIKAKLKRYDRVLIGPHNLLHRGFEQLLLKPFREVFEDTAAGYKEQVTRLGGNSVLIGYFQCYRYFESYWTGIAPELDMTAFVDTSWIAQQRKPWAAIHVRRGDYVGDARFEMKAPQIYYGAAMELVREAHSDIQFVVFSDDIEWCRSQAWLGGCSFYTGSAGRHPAGDLATMSQADSNIIGNSSYSWWAAWIGQHREKVIVAPAIWVDGFRSLEIQMVPPDWRTV